MLRRAWVRAAYGSGSPATGTQAPAKRGRARARHELGHQAGLADAGLARDDDHGGFSGSSATERVGQLLQDALASDQLAGGAEDHPAILRPIQRHVIANTGA